MPLFSHSEFDDHHEVVFCRDAAAGLTAIIAIHDLGRGPALGGCRMWPYENEDEALTDVLRLSRGMTYKSALADLPYGGGKSVILGDPRSDKSEALFLAMGRFVESLGGRYVIAEDVGIGVPDIETVAKETGHVAGVTAGGSGDPSPATAWGVFNGIRAAVVHRLGRSDLNGVKVAVQGLGSVGYALCGFLAESGAELVVTDIDRAAVERAVAELGAMAVAPEAVLDAEVDVFAPCALGAVIDDQAVERLKAVVVAGSANNQLAEPRHGALLKDRGVLYAPDYVINAGGVINISHETRPGGTPYDKSRAFAHVGRIHDTLLEIFQDADKAGLPTSEAADRLAERRFKGSVGETAAAA